MRKILVTGATGFIGSNLVKRLLMEGFDVLATHRNSSSFNKIGLFKDQIEWINTDNSDWKVQIRTAQPDQLIHCAWSGIKSFERNTWDVQLQNFCVSKEYIELAISCKVKKIIALGSQAEYGGWGKAVNEETTPNPDDAYGAVKLLTSYYLRNACENAGIEWYWVRVFSVFGEGEDEGWLIPQVISNLLEHKAIALTTCEQRYNYLYVEDFMTELLAAVHAKKDQSGIYNICNSENVRLKDLLSEIAGLINVSPELLQFGAIPYRHNQNMTITGDNSKLMRHFHIKNDSLIGLKSGLRKTIIYYQEKSS